MLLRNHGPSNSESGTVANEPATTANDVGNVVADKGDLFDF